MAFEFVRYEEPPEILSHLDFNQILENIVYIATLMYEKGYSIESVVQNEASTTTEFIKMFDIFQSLEYDLDKINDFDVKSAYYGNAVTIGDYAPNREDIWRWIKIVNDMYDIITGAKGKWGYLLCSDGYPTINGKRILIRGDYVG